MCAEVLEFLADDRATYAAVYSVFGAAWFTDPYCLFPLIAARLNPGGVFAFPHPPAVPGAYGQQGMYKGSFTDLSPTAVPDCRSLVLKHAHDVQIHGAGRLRA
ncbi:hypothetical protein SUDANB106_03024 [Streptomyces sp. enrichment culture]